MPQTCPASRLHQAQSHAVATGPAIPSAGCSVAGSAAHGVGPHVQRSDWEQEVLPCPFLPALLPPGLLPEVFTRETQRAGWGGERERESFAPALLLHTDSFANFPELAGSLPPDFLPGSPGPQLPAPSTSLSHPGLSHPWAGLGPWCIPLHQSLWGLFWSCGSCLPPLPPRLGLHSSHLLLVTDGTGTVKGGGKRNGEARGARRRASVAHRRSTTLLLRALPQGNQPYTSLHPIPEVPGCTVLPPGGIFPEGNLPLTQLCAKMVGHSPPPSLATSLASRQSV